jgi:hypothetical protein
VVFKKKYKKIIKYHPVFKNVVVVTRFGSQSLLKTHNKKLVTVFCRNGLWSSIGEIFHDASKGYRVMAHNPRYIGEHYKYMNGIEQKFYNKNNTLRYYNFLDQDTIINLAMRRENFVQQIRLVSQDTSGGVLDTFNRQAVIKNLRKEISRIDRVTHISEIRLQKFCKDVRIPRDEGILKGVNGVREILEPQNAAIKTDEEFKVIFTGTTLALLGVG